MGGEKDKLDYFSILATTGMNILAQPNNISGFQSLLGKGSDFFRAWFPGGSNENDFFTSIDPNTKEGADLRERMISQIVRESGKTKEEVAATFDSSPEAYQRIVNEETNYLAGRGELSDVATYNTVLRMLAIQMAPILLGESGKTISDGDRRLIANALGLAETQDGNWNFVSSSSISEDQLRFRLSLVQQGLNRAHKTLDRRFKEAWVGLGYDVGQAEEAMGAAARARVARDPTSLTEGAYGGQSFKVGTEDGKTVYTFGN